MPCIAIPTGHGCGVASSTRTFVLNLEEGLLLSIKRSDHPEQHVTSLLMDAELTYKLPLDMHIAMALSTLANGIDTLLLMADKVRLSQL